MSNPTNELDRQSANPSAAAYSGGSSTGVSMDAPAFQLTSDDESSSTDGGGGGLVYVDPPPVESNYNAELGVCEVPEMDGSNDLLYTPSPVGETQPAADAASDIRSASGDFNLSNLSVGALEVLFTSLIGPAGSNNQLSLGLMFGLGVSGGVGSLFGGIKVQFSGEAEHNTEGKLKLQAGFSLGGYVRGEIASIFRVSAEAMGTIQVEGEYNSMHDFAGDMFNKIVEANRDIRSRISRYVGRDRVPDAINLLADLDTVEGVTGPRVTTSTRTTLSGSVEVGDDNGGASWSGGRTQVDFTATGGGEARETGTQVIYEGSHGISVGEYGATIGFKHTRTDSSNNDNDKEELELSGELSGVNGSISRSSCREVAGTITRGVEAGGNMASWAANTGREVLDGISERIQNGGAGATNRLSNSSKINVTLKFEKGPGDRSFQFKEFGVFMVLSLDFEARGQAPIGTTGLMGEVGTEFSGAITRPIFFYRP